MCINRKMSTNTTLKFFQKANFKKWKKIGIFGIGWYFSFSDKAFTIFWLIQTRHTGCW